MTKAVNGPKVIELLEQVAGQMEANNALLREIAKADTPVAEPLPPHARKRTVKRATGKRVSLVTQFDDLPEPHVLERRVEPELPPIVPTQDPRNAMDDVLGDSDD